MHSFFPVHLHFREVLQHVLVRIFNLVGGVTHRSQDIHHGAHQLVGVSIRNETFHLFVSGYVGCHADAQRDVTRHPLDLVAVRRKSYGVEPTLKGGSVRIVHSNAIKQFLIPYFPSTSKTEEQQEEEEDDKEKEEEENDGVGLFFVIKRNNTFMCLSADQLKFLDMTNYVAPGFSYDKYLKAYGCEVTKGYFP